MSVIDLGGPADVVPGHAHAWGGPLFMARLAAVANIMTLEPTDDWLPALPWRYRRRDVSLTTLSDAVANPGRAFVKQPREKDFEAGVYTGDKLPAMSTDVPVLVSEIVTFTREYRLLALDGRVHTGSRYLTGGSLDVRPLAEDPDRMQVLGFAEALLDEVGATLPSAVTVDVGWAAHAERGDTGLAVVEANMAWFSNIYDCDPGRALDVVMRAAGPAEAVGDRDRPFVRGWSES